tara:strand:- start:465 stop:1433 length:969 start_codon:yes stop_codon:yes gene_type:complete
MRKIVAIAAGGDSAEVEISLLSAQTIYENLDRSKYEGILVKMVKGKWEAIINNESYPINKNDFSFQFEEKKIKFEYVFMMIHGTPGEDGKLQAYFDLLNIPYSSPDHIGSTLTFNKWYCNTLLSQLGFPVAHSVYLRKGDRVNEEEIIEQLGLPCFVKPCSCGSSYGVSKVKSKEGLLSAISKAFEFDHEIMIENELKGKEVTCGVYRKKGKVVPLPITQIIPEGEFFDYAAKYQGASQEITPARINEDIYTQVQNTTAKIYEKLNLRGVIRVDFMLVEDTAFVIELNTVPGMSKGSLVPQQVAAAKLNLTDFLNDIIDSTI